MIKIDMMPAILKIKTGQTIYEYFGVSFHDDIKSASTSHMQFAAVHADRSVSDAKVRYDNKRLTIVKLAVQSVRGSLDKGVLDAAELSVVDIAVNGIGSALLGEEKKFLEQHVVWKSVNSASRNFSV
jgi:hypothetical protein